MSKILVIGLGNDLLSDDAVGLLALRALRDRRGEIITTREIEYVECSEHGIALLDYFLDFDQAIIVDAIATTTHPAGTILHLQPGDLGGVVAPSPHYTGLPEMIGIADQLHLHFPSEIHIYACETADTVTLGGSLTEAVLAALPSLVETAQTELKRMATT